MYYAIKIFISAIIIVSVSEVAKRSIFLGAVTASLPLVSLLSICWLYHETRDIEKISLLSWEIFWLVIPSLAFFAVLPWLLANGKSFAFSMTAGTLVTIFAYFGMISIRRYLF